MHWSSAGALGILAIVGLVILAAIVMTRIDNRYDRRAVKRTQGPPKPAPEIDPTKW